MTALSSYLSWLEERRGLRFSSYRSLWEWSVGDLPEFWGSLWEYFQIGPAQEVLASRSMPGAVWFPEASLNYAGYALRHEGSAVVAYSQSRDVVRLSFAELRDQVSRAGAGLRALGVGRGDRVVGYLPNIPEAVVAFLATASLGAIWAGCAPEFGARSVVDRFGQLEPTVLLAVPGYRYGDKDVDRRAEVAAIASALPSLHAVVTVDYGPYPGVAGQGGAAVDRHYENLSWVDLITFGLPAEFEQVPFDHPLCVLFSSGTTGRPKAIVHGHGGVLLEHLKNHALSWDLRAGDVMLWFSTTAWMMWNALVSGLLVGASIVLIDGNPLYPDVSWQWRLAEETGATLMGASPGYIMTCRAEGLTPAASFDLSRLRQVGSVGSPLAAEGFAWVAEQFGPSVLLNVGSGGTDVCSGIVQGGPMQPVRPGWISGPALGVAACSYSADGRKVVGELGELVITEPMPSMPVGFWGDPDGSRYRAAYFEDFPGVWRHGDWVCFDADGYCQVAGRSDATLNRGGVRLGTADFYGVVEELPEIADSMVVHLEDQAGGNGELLLFVAVHDGHTLDPANIRTALRTALTPRHLPDAIHQVPSIPRNRTGKKLEVPAKRILQGVPVADVVSLDVLADQTSLDAFVALAAQRASNGKAQ